MVIAEGFHLQDAVRLASAVERPFGVVWIGNPMPINDQAVFMPTRTECQAKFMGVRLGVQCKGNRFPAVEITCNCHFFAQCCGLDKGNALFDLMGTEPMPCIRRKGQDDRRCPCGNCTTGRSVAVR